MWGRRACRLRRRTRVDVRGLRRARHLRATRPSPRRMASDGRDPCESRVGRAAERASLGPVVKLTRPTASDRWPEMSVSLVRRAHTSGRSSPPTRESPRTGTGGQSRSRTPSRPPTTSCPSTRTVFVVAEAARRQDLRHRDLRRHELRPPRRTPSPPRTIARPSCSAR